METPTGSQQIWYTIGFKHIPNVKNVYFNGGYFENYRLPVGVSIQKNVCFTSTNYVLCNQQIPYMRRYIFVIFTHSLKIYGNRWNKQHFLHYFEKRPLRHPTPRTKVVCNDRKKLNTKRNQMCKKII